MQKKQVGMELNEAIKNMATGKINIDAQKAEYIKKYFEISWIC